MAYTYDQLRAVAITAKCTDALSVIGSSALIVEIAERKRQRASTLHRILFGMSIFDVLSSPWFIIGSWAIPEGTSGVFQPSGNDATCATQGFFFQSISAIPIYMLSLSLYHLLIVNHNWKENQLKKYQAWFHVPPFVFGFVTASYGVIDSQFNSALLWCYFAGTEQSKALMFGLFYVPVWLVGAASFIMMMLIYRHVRQQERANVRYDFASKVKVVSSKSGDQSRTTASTQRRRHLSRPVLLQAVYYFGVFCLTFGFSTAFRLHRVYSNRPPFPIVFLMAFFMPLQGWMNYCVFKRRQIFKVLRKLTGQRDDSKTSTAWSEGEEPGPDLPQLGNSAGETSVVET